MDNFGEELTEVKKRINASNNILVTSHIRPDGDAIGSVLGLGIALMNFGKKVQMILTDGVPATYRFLARYQFVHNKPHNDYELIIVLDSSDFNRFGNFIDSSQPPDINIDHHLTNERFAKVNIVLPEAASTTEILANIFPRLGLVITDEIAQCLLMGLVTDTIGFRTQNVRATTMRTAADLIEKGADLPFLYQNTLSKRSFSAVKLWGYGLSRVERQGELVWTSLTQLDRKASGYRGGDDADLINILSTIEEAKVYIIFIEQPNKFVKVSWRSAPGFDVTKIAMLYGGGGHAAAAGAEIEGSLGRIQTEIINKTSEIFFGDKYYDK